LLPSLPEAPAASWLDIASLAALLQPQKTAAHSHRAQWRSESIRARYHAPRGGSTFESWDGERIKTRGKQGPRASSAPSARAAPTGRESNPEREVAAAVNCIRGATRSCRSVARSDRPASN
jgi:hypothetical protein